MERKECTEKEFWDAIRGQNVGPRVAGPYPYTTKFCRPNGWEVGRQVATLHPKNVITFAYFLTTEIELPETGNE